MNEPINILDSASSSVGKEIVRNVKHERGKGGKKEMKKAWF